VIAFAQEATQYHKLKQERVKHESERVNHELEQERAEHELERVEEIRLSLWQPSDLDTHMKALIHECEYYGDRVHQLRYRHHMVQMHVGGMNECYSHLINQICDCVRTDNDIDVDMLRLKSEELKQLMDQYAVQLLD
jgi:hypothetical protein